MTLNRDSVVDYASIADERAGRHGAAASRRSRTYLALAALLIGLELLILVIALLVQPATAQS